MKAVRFHEYGPPGVLRYEDAVRAEGADQIVDYTATTVTDALTERDHREAGRRDAPSPSSAPTTGRSAATSPAHPCSCCTPSAPAPAGPGSTR